MLKAVVGSLVVEGFYLAINSPRKEGTRSEHTRLPEFPQCGNCQSCQEQLSLATGVTQAKSILRKSPRDKSGRSKKQVRFSLSETEEHGGENDWEVVSEWPEMDAWDRMIKST